MGERMTANEIAAARAVAEQVGGEDSLAGTVILQLLSERKNLVSALNWAESETERLTRRLENAYLGDPHHSAFLA